MFFLSKIYNKQDRYKKILVINENVFYLGDSSITSYTIGGEKMVYHSTRWLYTLVYDGVSYCDFIILLTFDSLIVFNQHLNAVYKYNLDKRYSNLFRYSNLIILWNSKGSILLLHIFNNNRKIELNYPLSYDCSKRIFDIEFINNYLYVLDEESIDVLEYSGQFIEYTRSFRHEDGVKLEQEDNSLILITKHSVIKKLSNSLEILFKIHLPIVTCSKKGNKLFLINEEGEIYDSNGNKTAHIQPSLDFKFVKQFILTVGDLNCVYSSETCKFLFQLDENHLFTSGTCVNNVVYLSNGNSLKRLECKTTINKKDEPEQGEKSEYTFPKTYITDICTFYLSKGLIKLKTKQEEKEFNIDFYEHKFVDNTLIVISKEVITFISPLVVTKIECLSFKALFFSNWVITLKDNVVKFINIQKKKLEYFQFFKDNLVDVFLFKNFIFYKTKTESYLSILLDCPKPPTKLNENIEDCVSSFIKFGSKLITRNKANEYKTLKKEGKEFKEKKIEVNEINLEESSPLIIKSNYFVQNTTIYKLDNHCILFKKQSFPIKSYFELGSYLIYFSTDSLHVYEQDTFLYESYLGEYCCSTVANLIYIGYKDCIVVYKVGEKELHTKYEMEIEGIPKLLKLYSDYLIVSLDRLGLVVYKDNNLIVKDNYCRTIDDFIVENNTIYCSSETGSIYIYSLVNLTPLASFYVGKCVCLFFCKSFYFITNFGELGEVIEISKETAANLDKVDHILRESGLEYFRMFNRTNAYCTNYLREILKIEDESLFRVFKGNELSTMFKSILLDLEEEV